MDANLCLQSATIILDDDFIFENGNLFINEDVKISGSHDFIYSSTHKCSINKNSKLKFLQDTTFTYSPKSADRNLIMMKDKTSKLILKNSTLSTTYTGIRLTKGNLIFDGLVTITHLNINTEISSETTTQTTNITFLDLIHTITYQNLGTCVDFSPDGNLLAIGGNYHDGTGTGQIFKADSYNQIKKLNSIPFPRTLYTIAFSPLGNFLATGGDGVGGNNLGYIYKIEYDGNLTYSYEILYGNGASKITDIKWSNDGQFIVVSSDSINNGWGAQVFNVDAYGNPSSVTNFPSNYREGETACFSPDGNFIAAGGRATTSTPKIYRFDKLYGTLEEISTLPFGEAPPNPIVYSMQYSHDQKFLAVGGTGGMVPYDNTRIYRIKSDGSGIFYLGLYQTDLEEVRSISWSEDSKNLVVVGGGTPPNNSKIYTLDMLNKQILDTKTIEFGDSTGSILEATVSPDLRIYAFAGKWNSPLTSTTNAATYIFSPVYDELISTTVYYGNSNLHPRGLDNYVTFGNASIGKSENLYIDILSGAKVDVHGTLNIENVA